MKRVLLVAMAALALATAPASANVVFDLSNVTLSDGGDMTGSITLANNLASIVDLSITVSADAALGYQQITYVDTDTVSFQLPLNGFIRVDDASGHLPPGAQSLRAEDLRVPEGIPLVEQLHRHEPIGEPADHLVAAAADRRQLAEIVEQGERIDGRQRVTLTSKEQRHERRGRLFLHAVRQVGIRMRRRGAAHDVE